MIKDWSSIKIFEGERSFAYTDGMKNLIHGFIPSDENYWIVRIGKTDNALLKGQKKFKTRTQAIAYAKEYMKKH
jgi:hypothetical protein